MGVVDNAGAWDRTVPVAGNNWQTCECEQGVPVLDRYEENIAVWRCGLCNTEYRKPGRRRG